MEAHEERVVLELNQLCERSVKLEAFIRSDSVVYNVLPLMEKERLAVQLYLMQRLENVLINRIEYFNESS